MPGLELEGKACLCVKILMKLLMSMSHFMLAQIAMVSLMTAGFATDAYIHPHSSTSGCFLNPCNTGTTWETM